MLSSILTVCTGNICRSPMAEILLGERLKEEGVEVSSAGLMALVGHPADPLAIALLAERGLDATGHRARQITTEIATGAELILVMELWQQRDLEKSIPQVKGRVFRLGHWRKFDIIDPYRRGRESFAEALAAIDRGINNWIEVL
ncbi:MAG: low molecular weight phosphotyrosine protein phosphatase [Desulfobulbaceae bacterium]|nr:low molecular weight phosphotyrosine protein phosphatase [Desulfobulbaceae bacterium]